MKNKAVMWAALFSILTAVFISGIHVTRGESVQETESSETPVNDRADHYIDLHLHLDGAITSDIAKELAAIQDIELPGADDGKLESLLTVPDDCESLNDFLKCF